MKEPMGRFSSEGGSARDGLGTAVTLRLAITCLCNSVSYFLICRCLRKSFFQSGYQSNESNDGNIFSPLLFEKLDFFVIQIILLFLSSSFSNGGFVLVDGTTFLDHKYVQL